MNLASAIDLLVARIETFSPTVDPGVRFRRVDELRTGAYRSFMLQEQVQIEPNADTRPNPFVSTVTIQVFYDRRTERFTQFKAVSSDAEELFDRVVYSNDDQWGLASGLGIIFGSLEISGLNRYENENKTIVINLTIKLVYNVT